MIDAIDHLSAQHHALQQMLGLLLMRTLDAMADLEVLPKHGEDLFENA